MDDVNEVVQYDPSGPFMLQLSRDELYALRGAVEKDLERLRETWATTKARGKSDGLQDIIDKNMAHVLGHLQAVSDRIAPMVDAADTRAVAEKSDVR